ncbi:class I SAM-dependent methyltransferase [Streptomyces sp. NPDC048506]|uniref:class I SAM-dependent methyltransferase n=1 Tax=Streptomyces sp. NPDC048506 TaxID=3155028 RepID=UPI003413414C
MTGTDLTDAAVRAYLTRHPDATVVALGEGLGTGFWRLDNGRLSWLTVQPPETAAVRRMLLPDGARRRTVARAVADHRWLDAVREPRRGVVVAAPGVLVRLPAPAVRALVTACAERFPGGALVFDAPSWWATGVTGGHPGVAAVRARRPAGLGHRLPGLRALLPAVWEVRFAAARRGAGAGRHGGRGPAA